MASVIRLHLLDPAIMAMNRILLALAPCAGLMIGSSAWIVNTQLGQMLPYLDCRHQASYSAIASFAGAAVAGFAGAMSWCSANRAPGLPPATLKFIACVSALAALVFAFALASQGFASLVLSGCER
jgi:hypothetical protein